MDTIDEGLQNALQAQAEEIRTRFHVRSLSVFGSTSRGAATAESDIDILVEFSKTPGLFEFIRLKYYLEDLLGKPVDLVTRGALKQPLKDTILREAVRVS